VQDFTEPYHQSGWVSLAQFLHVGSKCLRHLLKVTQHIHHRDSTGSQRFGVCWEWEGYLPASCADSVLPSAAATAPGALRGCSGPLAGESPTGEWPGLQQPQSPNVQPWPYSPCTLVLPAQLHLLLLLFQGSCWLRAAFRTRTGGGQGQQKLAETSHSKASAILLHPFIHSAKKHPVHTSSMPQARLCA
jgi:hypothetical protein